MLTELSPGALLGRRYRLDALLGEGGMGAVWAATHTVTRQRVALKLLKSRSRKQSVVFARGLVVYLARELAAASYHEIGRALGGRDHTTMMHNYRNIERDRMQSSATQESLTELQRVLLCR